MAIRMSDPKRHKFEKVRSRDEYDELLSRTAPSAPDAENALLGSIILDNTLMAQALEFNMEPADFYVRANSFVWTAMVILDAEGQPINPITIGNVLRREGQLEQVGGVAFISELTSPMHLMYARNVAPFCKTIKGKARLREALKVVRMNEALILEEAAEPEEILAQVEFSTLEVVSEGLRGTTRRSMEFVDVAHDETDFDRMLVDSHEGRATGLETPLAWLNDKLEGGGVQDTGLYLVAAPPKVGKTSLLLWFANYWANVLNTPGGILTLEMRRMALLKRMFAQYTGIPFWMIRKGFRGTEYEVARKSVKPFFDELRGKFHILDSIHTLTQFRHAARRLVLGPTKARWLATDYLQLMSMSPDPDPYQRAAEVGGVSRGLKVVAQELGVPLFAISTLNQEGEREGRRPELTDLAWSGNLRYDAEAIMFMHNANFKRGMTREERQRFDAMKTWDIDLILAAQRNGPTGETRLKFVREYMQFLPSDEVDPQINDVPFEEVPVTQLEDGPLFYEEDADEDAFLR